MEAYFIPSDIFVATDANLKAIHASLLAFLHTIDAKAPAGSIAVGGSYMTRTLIRGAPNTAEALPCADLCVTMPNAACSEVEANEGHYETKRAAFCTSMAAYLAEKVENCTASVIRCNGRTDKSVVRVTFKAGGCPILIHPRIEGISDYLAKGMKKRGAYVNAILEDAAIPAMLKLVHGICASRPNYSRAVMVLKAWANHTGITAAYNSPFNHAEQFQPFIFALLVALLHESGIVSATMSEENVLRTVWVQLARGFIDGPRLLATECGFPLLNCLHRTSQRFIDHIVKPAAEEALKHTAAVEVFKAPRIIFPMLFSTVLRVKFAADTVTPTKLHELIGYALQDRLSYAFIQMASDKASALIFARVRTADGRNKLTKGPSLEQTNETEKFNQFWGASTVSTRQFADGSIHKCVSWGDQCFAHGRAALAGYANAADVMLSVADVTNVIVEGALRKHIVGLTGVAQIFEGVTDVVSERIGECYVDAAPVAHMSLQNAVADVTKTVTSVGTSLSCKVVGFDVVSGSARECDPYPVRPHAALTSPQTAPAFISTTPSIEPVYCVLTIDDKNKIPDNLEAIGKMKGALCAQLSNALVEAGHESFCTTISVDVITTTGYVFRIYVAHFREVSLLRALERAPQADMLERKLFWSVQHHKYVGSVYTSVHVTYSKAVRLAKRWVGAMLLGDFIAPEAIELIVGHGYVVPANKPRSAEEGFYRFLQLLATYDWSTPLILDNTIAVDHQRQYDREAMGMILLATYDTKQNSPFTSHTPRPMIVHRLAALAAGALRAFEEGRLTSMWLCDIPSSFDVALPLAPAMTLFSDRCIARAPVAPAHFRLWRAGDLTGADRQRYVTQLCELEPANFCLRALRGASRDKCMIFMDTYGPQSLAVVSLSQRPTPQQVRALVVSLMEAAPKGSLGHIELPTLPEPKPKKVKATKKSRDEDEGKNTEEAPAKAEAKKEKKTGNKVKKARTEADTRAKEPTKIDAQPTGNGKKSDKKKKK